MSPAQFLSYFQRISEAPEAIPRLRRFVLDLAVRGKLCTEGKGLGCGKRLIELEGCGTISGRMYDRLAREHHTERDKYRMDFIIAETFTRSLSQLTNVEQAAAKQTAFDFQIDQTAPGFNFEALRRPKDPNFRSLRVNQGWKRYPEW